MSTNPIPPNRLAPHVFLRRLIRNILYGFALILISLLIGMLGYHHFEKLDWVDSYANASMILSGMGPLVPLKTDSGKLFAGTYALFSGVVFLVIIAVIFAPIVHHFLHTFHLEENSDK